MLTIIVYSDRPCTKVNIRTNFRITNVGQVTSLSIFTDSRTLNLDEVTDMNAFFEHWIRTNMGKWTNGSTFFNYWMLNHWVSDDGIGTDSWINNISAVGQHWLCSDFSLSFKSNISFNHNVRCNFHIYINVCRIWILESNTINHVSLVNTTTHNIFCCS